MPPANSFFGPSERALKFGTQYAEVLARWGELFVAASKLVDANVELGTMTNEAGKEFEDWIQGTANAPWNWLNPDTMQRFMRNMGVTPPPQP